MAVCSNCGKEINDDSMFCSGCGQKLVDVPTSEPAESAASNEKGKKPSRIKNKKMIGIIAGAVALVVIGVVLFFVLRKNDAQKIASAFQKTLTSKSFACEGYVKYSREAYNFSGEIYSDKSTDLFYLSMDYKYRDYDEDQYVYAFVNDAYYEGYCYYDYYYDEPATWHYYKEDDEQLVGILKKICQRDFFGAAKYDAEVEEEIKDACKNYKDIPDILITILKDVMKHEDDLAYIKSVKKKDKSYTFVIDAKSFVKAAKKDYGLKIDSEMYDEILDELEEEEIGDVELTITLDKGYIRSLYAEVEVDRKTAEAYVEFSKYNSVKVKDSEAYDFVEKAEKYFYDRDNQVKLTLWTPVVPSDSNWDAYQQALRDMKERYPNVEVTMESTYRDDYKYKIMYAMEGDYAPDIFFTWSGDFLGDFVKNGKVYCLDNMYQNYKDNLSEVMCRNTTYDGKKYGVPLTMNVVTLFANMDLLKKAGYNDVPTTYDDFVRCCDALVAKGITPFGCAGAADQEWCITEYIEPLIIKTAGADVLDEIFQGKRSWNDSGVAKAIDLFNEFMRKGYFSYYDAAFDNDSVKANFMAGEYAFYQNGSWNCSDLSSCGLNIKACEFPVMDSSKSKLGQLTGGPNDTLAVFAGSKNPEFAAKYAFELGQLISKYCYLSGAGLPSWKVDYEQSGVNYLMTEVARLVEGADYLVLFGDNLQPSEVTEVYLKEIRKVYDWEITGSQFCADLAKALGWYVDSDIPQPTGPVVTPDPKPVDNRDCRGLRVTLLDWWSNPDYWDDVNNAYDEAFFDMLHEAEWEHNFTFRRMNAEYGWGDSYIESTMLSITNNTPDGQIITLDNRWVGPLLANGFMMDVSRATTVDWNDAKWNAKVKELMTINGGIYGFAVGTEARTGVFFNKDIFKQLGVDPDTPYDLQKSGRWSWDEFLNLCSRLTKDTNNDGRTDIYAVAGQAYIVAFGALQSNGTFVIEKDNTGLLRLNVDDPNVLSALNFVCNMADYGYFMPTPEGAEWDWFKTAFYDGKTAMYIEEEWADTQEIRYKAPQLDYGFVCFPYGPAVGKSVSIIRENILFIPKCDATKDIVDDILYAYNWYTTIPEEYVYDEDRWKKSYDWKFNDDRAVEETIRLMVVDGDQYMYAGTLIPNFSDQWCFDLQNGKSAVQVLEENTNLWYYEVSDFNDRFR